jgi:hypothetical protein
MLKHGENIVDMMGAEIDRIEMKLRVSIWTQRFISNTNRWSPFLGFLILAHITISLEWFSVILPCVLLFFK